MDEPVDDSELQARLARERLAVLNALVIGQERHAEVTAVLWAAEDRRAVIAAVAELLGVDPGAEQAVVELPWWRLGAGSRRQAAKAVPGLLRDQCTSHAWLADGAGLACLLQRADASEGLGFGRAVDMAPVGRAADRKREIGDSAPSLAVPPDLR